MGDKPKQDNSGADAIQINGDNNTINSHTHHHQHDHLHQHQHQHQHTVHAHGPVLLQTTVVQQVPEFALQPPPAPPARTPKPKRPAYDLSPAMREALALMRPLPKPVRIDLLTWMRCEFGTGMVAELEPRELYRLRAHVLEVRQRGNLS